MRICTMYSNLLLLWYLTLLYWYYPRRKVEEEVGKLSKQLEEVKSLLREVTKHTPHQQAAPEALDQVPSDARDDQPSQQ